MMGDISVDQACSVEYALVSRYHHSLRITQIGSDWLSGATNGATDKFCSTPPPKIHT